MAVYQFSALSDGQAISFNPSSDVLNFDQTAIAAADIRATVEGSHLRISVAAGTSAGKDVLLLNVSAFQLATTNITFANGTRLLFGDNTTATSADNGNNSLVGTTGRDHLSGFGGNDTLNGGSGADYLDGGLGDDTYFVSSGDVLVDAGGLDQVMSGVNWTLGVGFENLTLTGTTSILGIGNVLNNVIIGNSGNNGISGRDGNDTLVGGAGNDTFVMSMSTNYGSDSIDGGTGVDVLDFGVNARTAIVVDLAAGTLTGGATDGAGSATLVSIENVNGGAFNDRITGNASANFLYGYNGNDTLDGGAGNDRLQGAAGNDQYVFSVAPGAANADTIVDFVSGGDKVVLDGRAHLDLGANGNFAAGDARFVAGAGFTSGQDASDRVIYNTTTGQLFHDADGSGSGAAQLIATLTGAPTLAAADIAVINGTSGGLLLTGTAGNDSLTGAGGNDTINGLAGSDTLDGAGGNDSVSGGAGDDSLVGGDGNDTLEGGAGYNTFSGGLGDDTYRVSGWQDTILADSGGLDTVITETSWSLGTGIENLTLVGTEDYSYGSGNDLANLIIGSAATNNLNGYQGNDTILAGGGDDFISTEASGGNSGNDSVDGGAGFDTLYVGSFGPAVVDFAAGTATNGSTSIVTFANMERFVGGSYDDRMEAGATTAGVTFEAYNGNDTLIGGAGADRLDGGWGVDQITGGAGNDTLSAGGNGEQDTLDGGDGVDTFSTTGGTAPLVDLGAGVAGSATLVSIENALGSYDADTLVGSAGANVLDGAQYHDSLDGAAGNDTLLGGGGNDTLLSGAGSDSLAGDTGDDWFHVDAGNDTLSTGAGHDRVLFAQAPNSANADLITDFVSGTDELVFDAGAHADIGPVGNLAAGDERFWAASGATNGHDATDRFVYNTTTGELFYDADGSNAGAAVRIATLQGASALAATDIVVMSGGVSGALITGTANDDRLEGGSGNDTLQGLAGNDTLVGNDNFDVLDGGEGSDSMVGGSGNDTLYGGSDWYEDPMPVDTMDGGLGNDTYIVGPGVGYWGSGGFVNDGVVLQDAGGVDTIIAQSGEWMLGAGFENLELSPWYWESSVRGVGNELDNVITLHSGEYGGSADGADGDDTLIGSGSDEWFEFSAGSGNIGDDSVVGGGGRDMLDFFDARSAVRIDLGAGTATGGGLNGSGSVAFTGIASAGGGSFNDVLIASDANFPDYDYYYGDDWGAELRGNGGNDTLLGGAAADYLSGDGYWSYPAAFGDDELRGGSGEDSLYGGRGSDWIDGGAGQDFLYGEDGADTFAFSVAPGDANADWMGDFATGSDVIRLDTAVYGNLGTQGRLSAGDERFYAAAGASAAHDASDRIVFDTSTRELWYDADGIGGSSAMLIATLGAGSVAVTDLIVGLSDPVSPGQNRTGTAANDTLTGGTGDDTLDGAAGHDSLVGGDGRDSLIGGAGDDTLDGGSGNDTMAGGTGNDTYVVSGLSDSLSDTGGVDTVVIDASANEWGLAPEFENMVLRASAAERHVIGNEAANAIDGSAAARMNADGRGGNDSLTGGTGDDTLNGGAGDDRLLGGAGHDDLFGQLGSDSLVGADGNDWLVGGAWSDDADSGSDTLEGGTGDDALYGGRGNDVLRGDPGNDGLYAGLGSDSVFGGDGNDYISLGDYNRPPEDVDFVDGGAGRDQIAFYGAQEHLVTDLETGSVTRLSDGALIASLIGIEDVIGSQHGDDLIIGNALDNNLWGGDYGSDTLLGGAGNDTLSAESVVDGGTGNDRLLGGDWMAQQFVFSVTPGAANADVITHFGASDRIVVDNTVHRDLGAAGDFSVGDERFFAAAGATSGQEADDRVIYNSTTGELYYDSDGSGTGASRLIATLENKPTLQATGITVIGDGSAPGVEGTAGNDSLAGTAGDDYIDGLAGDDTIDGAAGDDELYGGEGNDSVIGGLGNDSLDGGAGVDTLNGGADNDLYVVTSGDVLLDGGGADTVISTVSHWELGAGFENLIMSAGALSGFGNTVANVITGNSEANSLSGRGGDDTIDGGAGHDGLTGEGGNDSLRGGDGDDNFYQRVDASGSYGVDFIDGGFGRDTINFDSFSPSGVTVDLTAGTVSGGGGSATVTSIEWVYATAFNDRIVGNWDNNYFVGQAGNDTLEGAGGNDQLEGSAGNDSLIGGDGSNTLTGGEGSDTMLGGEGSDLFGLGGLAGSQDVIDGGGGLDSLRYDIGGNAATGVTIDLGAGIARGGGSGGAGSVSFVNVENAHGGVQGDSITGSAGGNALYGWLGDDTLNGAGGSDTLDGGPGADAYVFSDAPGSANADLSYVFASGVDKIRLDALDMPALGASGNFAPSDPRFYSAAGANSGHDADDRVVYNTTTGQLWYDADGSGAGAAQLIATFQTWNGTTYVGSALAATDIAVDNGTAPPPPPPPSGGQTITGTAANDTLNGGAGDDTLIGNAGADTLFGREGNDRLEGGTGQDRLNGNAGSDSFAFNVAPGSTNFDYVNDFVSGTDDVLLDDAAFAAIGAAGMFSAGDERFVAAPGARAGLEADDRVMYDTSTGKLYYDPDGSGIAGQQVIAVLTGAPILTASDITVI